MIFWCSENFAFTLTQFVCQGRSSSVSYKSYNLTWNSENLLNLSSRTVTNSGIVNLINNLNSLFMRFFCCVFFSAAHWKEVEACNRQISVIANSFVHIWWPVNCLIALKCMKIVFGMRTFLAYLFSWAAVVSCLIAIINTQFVLIKSSFVRFVAFSLSLSGV